MSAESSYFNPTEEGWYIARHCDDPDEWECVKIDLIAKGRGQNKEFNLMVRGDYDDMARQHSCWPLSDYEFHSKIDMPV